MRKQFLIAELFLDLSGDVCRIEMLLVFEMIIFLLRHSVFFFRVLCALVNSFVPETFTTEVLLNDRSAIKC